MPAAAMASCGFWKEMQVPLNRIHHLFVTHEHTDHILGVIWMIRMIGTAIKKGNYEGIFSYFTATTG